MASKCKNQVIYSFGKHAVLGGSQRNQVLVQGEWYEIDGVEALCFECEVWDEVMEDHITSGPLFNVVADACPELASDQLFMEWVNLWRKYYGNNYWKNKLEKPVEPGDLEYFEDLCRRSAERDKTEEIAAESEAASKPKIDPFRIDGIMNVNPTHLSKMWLGATAQDYLDFRKYIENEDLDPDEVFDGDEDDLQELLDIFHG